MTTPTDPLDGIALPYSAVMRLTTVGSSYLYIPEGMRTSPGSDRRLAVPPGVAIIQFTWDGPYAVWFSLQKGGGPHSGFPPLPASPERHQTHGPFQVSSESGMEIWAGLTGHSATQADLDARYTLGVSVIPIGGART